MTKRERIQEEAAAIGVLADDRGELEDEGATARAIYKTGEALLEALAELVDALETAAASIPQGRP